MRLLEVGLLRRLSWMSQGCCRHTERERLCFSSICQDSSDCLSSPSCFKTGVYICHTRRVLNDRRFHVAAADREARRRLPLSSSDQIAPLLVPLLLLYVFHTHKMIKESKNYTSSPLPSLPVSLRRCGGCQDDSRKGGSGYFCLTCRSFGYLLPSTFT